MEIFFAGTGTSHGIPVIGCTCPVCTSQAPEDTRTRSSLFVKGSDGTSIVIDTGPDFREQALRAKLKRLDAVLYTHSHADHLHGIDDLRIFSHRSCICEKAAPPLPVYANTRTLNDIRGRFNYIFSPAKEGGGKPHLELIDASIFSAEHPLYIGDLEIIPVPLLHGHSEVYGWKISEKDSANKKNKAYSLAYLTDCNFISEPSIELVRGADILVINALRERPHSTHLSFAESIAYAHKIGAHRSFFTHICHDFSHKQIKTFLAVHADKSLSIAPAYDGLVLNTPLAP